MVPVLGVKKGGTPIPRVFEDGFPETEFGVLSADPAASPSGDL